MEKPEKENFPRPAFDYSGISDKPTPEYKPDYKYEYDEPKKSSRKVLYISFAVFILAFAFGVSALFKSAKITFASKDQQIQLSSNFTANKNDESGLSFQIVTISKDIQKTVAVTSQAPEKGQWDSDYFQHYFQFAKIGRHYTTPNTGRFDISFEYCCDCAGKANRLR